MTGPAVVDGVDIDAVTAAVRACAAVDDLYSSAAASVASYLPGRQVAGIRLDESTLTVQVRSRWGIPVLDVATQVRTAVRPLVPGRTVDVVIADITDAPSMDAALTSPTPVSPTEPPARARHLADGDDSSVTAVTATPTLPMPAPVTPMPAVTPAPELLVMPVDVAGEQAEQDEVVWTTSTGDADASSSAPIIPTAAETRPPSSPA